MKTMLMVIAAAGLMFACGKSDIVKEAGKFRDRMCACKDNTCMDKVEKDRIAWFKGKGKKASDDDKKAMQPIVNEYRKCISKLVKADMAKKKGAKGKGDKAEGDKKKAAPK